MMFVTTLFNYVGDDWDAKVVMECVIRHIPWCICHCSEYLRLEPLCYCIIVLLLLLYLRCAVSVIDLVTVDSAHK
jgi:hypothetical protein